MADRDELIDRIKILPAEQFYELAARCGYKSRFFGEGTTLSQRMVALLEFMEDRDETLEKLNSALLRVLDPTPMGAKKQTQDEVTRPPASETHSGRRAGRDRAAHDPPLPPPGAPSLTSDPSVAQQAPPSVLPPLPIPGSVPAPPPIPERPPISRAALRHLIDSAFPDPGTLDEFLVDYFFEVSQLIQSDHDRTTRINLLFMRLPEDRILAAVQDCVPKEVYADLILLAEPDPEPTAESMKAQSQYDGRIELRKLLERIFPFDSELNAFCLDYFPEISSIQSASKDIDRTYKHDLLINSARPAKLFACLYRRYPEALRQRATQGADREPTLASLRNLLQAVLPVPSELLEFCINVRPDLARRRSGAFDRVRVENLLLQGMQPAALLESLRSHWPQHVERFRYLLEFDPPPLGTEEKASLQDLLSRGLSLDSEVDAFCMDYFSAVYRTFTEGTNKDEKLKRLIDGASADAIWRALRRQLYGVAPDSLLVPAAMEHKVQTRSGLTISQRMLRKIVANFFRTDEDFMEFCVTCFPHSARLLMPAMDRSRKNNILLQKVNHATLVARMRELDLERFEQLATTQLELAQDFIEQLTSLPNRDITRPELRRLLTNILRTHEDLLSFCADYAPSVLALISVGMDRQTIFNLLLERFSTAALFTALYHHFPEQVRVFEAQSS